MIRRLTEQDAGRVREIFEQQGFGYALPEVSRFVESIAVDDGGLRAAIAARPTVEVYLFLDATWETPGIRAASLKLLHREMAARLRAIGFEDEHMWIPPQLSRFTKRLIRDCGFERIGPEWPCLTRLTNG